MCVPQHIPVRLAAQSFCCKNPLQTVLDFSQPMDILPRMILQKGEKVHMIHRRILEKDPHRHFVGVVDAYENGVARVTGHMYTVDPTKFSFFKRPEKRTRIISLISGDVFVNVLPDAINLDDITYKQEKKCVLVTDGKDWRMEISEFAWR